MKLFELLNEDIDPNFNVPKVFNPGKNREIWQEVLPTVVKLIKTECRPWLNELRDFTPDEMIYRGIRQDDWESDDPMSKKYDFFSKPVRLNRKPKDTPSGGHAFLNTIINMAGKVANRTNSIFCTGDDAMASTYGSTFLVFPRGNFHYTWNEEIRDHTTEILPLINQAYGLKNPEAYEKNKNAVIAKSKNHIDRLKKEIAFIEKRIEYLEKDIPEPKEFSDEFPMMTTVPSMLRNRLLRAKDLMDSYLNPSAESVRYYTSDYLIHTDPELAKKHGFNVSFYKPGLNDIISNIKGDDNTLPAAIYSSHEIMISCGSAYYLSMGSYYNNQKEFFRLMKE